jgi:DNA-binding LacI/PurR family transcriptional regulator
MAMSVRLIDIAQKAGVSKITVAKVLHNTGGQNTRVGEATAERVRKIAAELNYRPNLTARQLSGRKSFIIGAIIDSSATETVIKELATIERLAMEQDYRLMVGYSHGELHRISNYIDDFLGRGIDGVICLSHTYPEYGHKVAELFKVFKHCVFIESPLSKVPFPSVTPNFTAAGYLVTRHLVSLGYSRIAIIQDGVRNRNVQQEFCGYQRALDEAGLAIDTNLIWQTEDSLHHGLDTMNICLKALLPAKPEAIITPNDGKAIWLIKALYEQGLRVPDDLAVVSTDRWEIGQGCIPSITSMDLRPEEVACNAANILLKELQNSQNEQNEQEESSDNQTIVIQPELFMGQSCGGLLKKTKK